MNEVQPKTGIGVITNYTFAKRMVNLLSGHNGRVPLDGAGTRKVDSFGSLVAMNITDDAGDVGIEKDGEFIHFDRHVFHAFIFWYLIQWAKEGFGMRRAAYYFFLKKECDRRNKIAKEYRNKN